MSKPKVAFIIGSKITGCNLLSIMRDFTPLQNRTVHFQRARLLARDTIVVGMYNDIFWEV